MRRIMFAAPALVLLAGCGGGEITTTNTGNVVLNDAQANFASQNDNEGPIVNEMADDNMMMVANDTNMTMPMDNGTEMNGTMAR